MYLSESKTPAKEKSPWKNYFVDICVIGGKKRQNFLFILRLYSIPYYSNQVIVLAEDCHRFVN